MYRPRRRQHLLLDFQKSVALRCIDVQEKNSKNSERRAFSVPELSEQYGLSVRFLRLEIERGNIPVTKLSRRVLVMREDWDAYLAKNGAKP